VLEIEEAHACDLHLCVDSMPRTGGMELSGELTSHVFDALQEWTGRSHTLGRWNLRDHRSPTGVGNDEMHIGIEFVFVAEQDG
jgi:hypothetical protein